MKFNKPPEFGARFQFPENMNFEYDGKTHTLVNEIVVNMAEKYDNFIVEQIAMTARAEGISDLTVLNKVAILEALERRTPRKPRNDGWLYCPVCGKDVLQDYVKFCPDCGQAIDWSEENEST